jgi:hypothetical protein
MQGDEFQHGTIRYMHDGAHPFNQSRGTNMKQTRLVKILAAGVTCAGLSVALAQQPQQPAQQQLPQQQQQQQQTTSTTTNPATGTATMATATGTFATYAPGSTNFMFRPSPNAAPVRYYQTRNMAIVDAEGHAVDQSTLRPGVGATIYYITSGDRMIVQKIVVSESTGTEKKGAKTATKPRP